MSDVVDPVPWLAAIGLSGGGGGLLGVVLGRRQSKADAALTEVRAARESVATLSEALAFLRGQVAQLRDEIAGLQHAAVERDVLIEYVDGAWRVRDAGGEPDRPARVVAIVRPEMAARLTGPVPVIRDDGGSGDGDG